MKQLGSAWSSLALGRVKTSCVIFFLSRLGHDAGTQSRWYYDSSDGTCKEFEYKGMKGNGNRFLTRQDCIASCQPSQVSIALFFIIDVSVRDLPWFFDQVGHQTTNASIENKYFFH